MGSTAAARLAEFESRACYAPDQVLTHLDQGWRYIAIHPFADDLELLKRLDLSPDRCMSVDAYWECASDIYFLQVEAVSTSDRARIQPLGNYYRSANNPTYVANLVAILEPGSIRRQLFESVMAQFATSLPLRGRAKTLSALP